MLARIVIVFACVSAVFAAPLPTTDTCKHCLFFHPFQKDSIAYCQAQNLCPIHDDAAASNILLKVDPSTVPFNTTLSTIGQSCCVLHALLLLALAHYPCHFQTHVHVS